LLSKLIAPAVPSSTIARPLLADVPLSQRFTALVTSTETKFR
jgi:hypothetical protein